MDFSQYLHDIPALIMTAIAALGGTATGVGALFSWVAKAIRGLKAGKNDYEEKAGAYEEQAKRLEERSDKLAATGATLETFGKIIEGYGEQFAQLATETAEQSAETRAKFDILAGVLLLIAENTPQLVQNGTADSIKRLLYPDKTDNTIEPVEIEVPDEIDG